MAGANPASPGTPGRVGETRHSAGATRHWRGTRNAAPTCRRCGGTAAVGGRCTAPGTVRHVAFFGAAGAHQRAAGGLRGTFRDFAGAPATAGRGAGCRGAPPRGGREAEQTLPGPAGFPATGKDSAPKALAAAAGNGKPQPPHWTAAESASKGEPRHCRGSDDLLQGAGRPIKTQRPHARPGRIARLRRGRSALRGSPFPSTTPSLAARFAQVVVQLPLNTRPLTPPAAAA